LGKKDISSGCLQDKLRKRGVVAPKLGSIREAGPATTLCKIKQMRGSLTTPTAPKDRCGPLGPNRWGEPPSPRREPSPLPGRGGGQR